MLLENGFEILAFSDVKYEILSVEIQYNGEQLAQLNIDKGPDNIEIEIYEFGPHTFSLNDFLHAVEIAKEWVVEHYKNTKNIE